MFKFFNDRPWFLYVALFVTMILGCIVVVIIAVRNEPASIPLDTPVQTATHP